MYLFTNGCYHNSKQTCAIGAMSPPVYVGQWALPQTRGHYYKWHCDKKILLSLFQYFIFKIFAVKKNICLVLAKKKSFAGLEVANIISLL